MNLNIRKNGFTLVEVMVALTILVAAITLALTGYMLLLKKTNNLDTQLELDIDVQKAIERLKIDLRLSSMDEIYGYPENTPPYEAISFPVASINTNTGMIERDYSGDTPKIIWDQTVLYHIVSGSPDQLTRTSFNYSTNRLDTERQAILNHIADDGAIEDLNGLDNVQSKVIFNNLLNWELIPEGGWFSTYSESSRLASIALGYAMLEEGENVLEFTAIDNDNGFKLGIDQIIANTSLQYHEAELALDDSRVSNSGGSTPTSQTASSAGNRHELFYNARAAGNSITLTIPNDVWEVADFSNLPGSDYMERERTVIEPDYTLNDIVVALDGDDISWKADEQTADFTGFEGTPTNLVGSTVSILLKGSQVEGGGFINYNGGSCKLTFRAAETSDLRISDISIGESVSSNSINLISTTSTEPVNFSGSSSVTISNSATATSDWVDIEIYQDKNYLITFKIESASAVQLRADNRATDLSLPATTRIVTSDSNVLIDYILPALDSVFVSYAVDGTYTSDIMDTRIDSPDYDYLSWLLEFNGGGCAFKVRSGDKPDLSDAAAFDTITAWLASVSDSSQSIASQSGRYIQFQAILSSDSDHTATPKLRLVKLNWAGKSRMAELSGMFRTGPDYGDFQVTLNGNPLRSALKVDMEIYKDITQGVNDSTQRISSAIKADITPRNSGL